MTALRSVVLGCGSYLPRRIMTNADLAARIDTSDDWIVQRTGIRQRHIAAEGEFTFVALDDKNQPRPIAPEEETNG